MVIKRDFQLWGKISSYTGGILFALGAGILFLSVFIDSFVMPSIGQDLILKTILFGVELKVLHLAIIGVVLGAGIIITVSAEPPDLVTGIILLVIGVFGLGIPGFFTVIGGILFIIASTRKR